MCQTVAPMKALGQMGKYSTVTSGVTGRAMFALAVKGIPCCWPCGLMSLLTLCTSQFVGHKLKLWEWNGSKKEIGFWRVSQDKKLSSLNWVIYNFNFCSDRTLEPYCNSKSVSQTSLLCSPMNIWDGSLSFVFLFRKFHLMSLTSVWSWKQWTKRTQAPWQ